MPGSRTRGCGNRSCERFPMRIASCGSIFPALATPPSRATSSPTAARSATRFDAAGVDRAAVIGTSLGGRAALEFAVESPERVSALVLVGAGIDDHEWSEEVTRFVEERSEEHTSEL